MIVLIVNVHAARAPHILPDKAIAEKNGSTGMLCC
jgi:hypothetical protein